MVLVSDLVTLIVIKCPKKVKTQLEKSNKNIRNIHYMHIFDYDLKPVKFQRNQHKTVGLTEEKLCTQDTYYNVLERGWKNGQDAKYYVPLLSFEKAGDNYAITVW